jgi:hypothetical protein
VKLLGSPAVRFPLGYQVTGITVDAKHGRAILMATPDTGLRGTFGPGFGAVQLDVWKLADLARGTVASDLAAPAAVPTECAQPLGTNFASALVPSPDGKSVFFGCVGTTGLSANSGPVVGEIAGIARYEMLPAAGTTATFRMFPMAGKFGLGESVTAPHSDRIVISSNGSSTTNFKVFDTTHEHYVGNVGIAAGLSGLTSNPDTGRGYMVVGGGLGVFELETTPVTQGTVLSTYAPVVGSLQRVIAFDPRTRRLLVPVAPSLNSNNPYVLVLRDPVDRRDFAKVADPDADSLNVAEQPGSTDSQRVATAAAFGAETRLVGGTGNLAYNLSHTDLRASTHPGTRDAQFGAVTASRLTNNEASAYVVTARYDEVTTGETGRDVARLVSCNDFGAGKTKDSDDNASVTCDLTANTVDGSVTSSPPRVLVSAAQGAPALPAAVQVKSASAHLTMRRLASGATQTTITAESDGVDILGAVTIGRIVATAVTTTHGHPGTAHTDYKVTFSDVAAGGQQVCAASCSAGLVKDRVNDALAGRAQADFPGASKVQSDGGTTASIEVNQYQHVEDTLFADEPDSSVVTPAMIVTVFADGIASSRQITRLAAVSVNQNYRIYRLSTTPGSIPSEPPTFVPGKPGTPGTLGGTTTTGTTTSGGKPTAQGGTDSSGIPGVLGSVISGLRVVFRQPGQILGIACVWMLLALPAYLAARRRLLLELPRLRRVQEDA